jgi:hypothetical protein
MGFLPSVFGQWLGSRGLTSNDREAALLLDPLYRLMVTFVSKIAHLICCLCSGELGAFCSLNATKETT